MAVRKVRLYRSTWERLGLIFSYDRVHHSLYKKLEEASTMRISRALSLWSSVPLSDEEVSIVNNKLRYELRTTRSNRRVGMLRDVIQEFTEAVAKAKRGR